MLLVDKLNKGKLPEKPDKGESAPVPGLSSLVVKPQNIAARIPNVDVIKRTIHERLIAALGQNSDAVSSDVIQRRITELTDEYCEEAKLKLTKHDRAELAELILHDVLGLGPLESLLEDAEVSEIISKSRRDELPGRGPMRGRPGQHHQRVLRLLRRQIPQARPGQVGIGAELASHVRLGEQVWPRRSQPPPGRPRIQGIQPQRPPELLLLGDGGEIRYPPDHLDRFGQAPRP